MSMQWSSIAVKAFIDENNRGIQTYCLVVLAMFAIGSLMLTLSSVILPLLFALFLSLHFSPLIELLKCKRGPRCCREFNLPCRRAIKDRLMICKGPDNEHDRNCFNSCVRATVDLFCGFKFPAWLAILTTFGVIVAFFAIIGLIISGSVDFLLKDREKWADQWNLIVADVVAFGVQQGFALTTEDVNSAASDFAIQNILNPLAAILPLAITYTFLTLAFLVFVLVSPSTFFGDPDSLEATDPDDISCSDDDVNDEHIAAAVDNVITAQAAAMLAEEDDEDDGLLGENLVAKATLPRSAMRADHRSHTLGPESSAWIAAAAASASTSGRPATAGRNPRRRTMTDRGSKRRLRLGPDLDGASSSGAGDNAPLASRPGTGIGEGSRHARLRGSHGRPVSAQKTISPQTLRRWQLDLELTTASAVAAAAGQDRSPIVPQNLQAGRTATASDRPAHTAAPVDSARPCDRDEDSHTVGQGTAGSGSSAGSDGAGREVVHPPGAVSSPRRAELDVSASGTPTNRQRRSGSQDPSSSRKRDALSLPHDSAQDTPGNRLRVVSADDSGAVVSSQARPPAAAFVEAPTFDSDSGTAATEPGLAWRGPGDRDARTSASDRAMQPRPAGSSFLRGAGVGAALRSRGAGAADSAQDDIDDMEPGSPDAGKSTPRLGHPGEPAGTAVPAGVAADGGSEATPQRGSAWVPPGGDAPLVAGAAHGATDLPPRPGPATRVNWAEALPSAGALSPGFRDGDGASSSLHVETRRAAPLDGTGSAAGATPVSGQPGGSAGDPEVRRQEATASPTRDGPSPTSQRGASPALAGPDDLQGGSSNPNEARRGRAASSLMHKASKVLEVVGLGTADGSTTENDEDTEDEFPLEYLSAEHQQELVAMKQLQQQHGHASLDPEALHRQAELNHAAKCAMDENRRRLRAWAKRQKRKGRYPDSSEATAVMLHQKAQNRVTRYIVVHTWLSVATGLGVGISLWIIGAPLPALFGLLTFVLNFVPSVGSWVAMILPIPFILFDPDSGVTTLILAIVLPGFMQIALGNFIEPALLGKLCKVDPIVILVSILLFGFVWGIAGMVLAVPMVVIIKLVFKQMAHPIPRYIAGMIVGNLYRYRARLDRDVRRRIRYARLLRAAESAYHTAESSFPLDGSVAEAGSGRMQYDPYGSAKPNLLRASPNPTQHYSDGRHHSSRAAAEKLARGSLPRHPSGTDGHGAGGFGYPQLLLGSTPAPTFPDTKSTPTGHQPPLAAQFQPQLVADAPEGVRQRWTRGNHPAAVAPADGGSEGRIAVAPVHPHRPHRLHSPLPVLHTHVRPSASAAQGRVRVPSSSLFDDDVVMEQAVAEHEMALRAVASGLHRPERK